MNTQGTVKFPLDNKIYIYIYMHDKRKTRSILRNFTKVNVEILSCNLHLYTEALANYHLSFQIVNLRMVCERCSQIGYLE